MVSTRLTAAIVVAVLVGSALAAPAAVLAQASGTTVPAVPPSGPFGGLPPAIPEPEPVVTDTDDDNDDGLTNNTILFIVAGGALVFAIIFFVIRRDLQTAVPNSRGGSREDRRIKNQGPKEQPIQQRAQRKQRQRAKGRAAKQARRSNRPR